VLEIILTLLASTSRNDLQLDALLTRTSGRTTVVFTLYNHGPKFEEWIGNHIELDTFPRFVAYFWPCKVLAVINILGSDDGKRFFKDALLARKYYTTIPLRIHPDRDASHIQKPNSRLPASAMAILNDAWDLWKPIVEDTELVLCELFIGDTEREFKVCLRSTRFL
jgi:hypothetical protein